MGEANDNVYAMFLGTNSELCDSSLAVKLHCRNLGLSFSWGLGCDTVCTSELPRSPLQVTDCCWSHRDRCAGTGHVKCFQQR